MVSSTDVNTEWTVSKCFRVLRPIASRKSIKGSHGSIHGRKRLRQNPATTAILRVRFGDSPNPKLDPDWMSKPRKLGPRQYTKALPASASRENDDGANGAWTIPTPMVQRIVSRQPLLPQIAMPRGQDPFGGRDIFNDHFLSQSDEVAFRSKKLVEGALDLIEATNVCTTTSAEQAFFPKIGARSLRAMCCKTLARRIVEIEDEQETDSSEEKFDVALQAFDLLDETMTHGASEYLRATTREYGIALFESMISKSQIFRSHAIALLRRIQHPKRGKGNPPSSSEIDSIVQTLLQAHVPDKPCCSRDNTFAHIFNTIADISSSLQKGAQVTFELRQVQVLADSIVPLCWFGSRRLTALWRNIFHALVDPNATIEESRALTRDAASFVSTLVSLDTGSKTPSDTADRLMNSTVVPDYHGNDVGCPKCPKAAHATLLNLPIAQIPNVATNHPASRKRLESTLDNSFSSLLAMLTSFAISSPHLQNSLDTVQLEGLNSLLNCMAMNVMMALNSPSRSLIGVNNRRNAYILLAVLLTVLTSKNSMNTIDLHDLTCAIEKLDRIPNANSRITTMELLPEFVYSVSQSIAKLNVIGTSKSVAQVVLSLTSSSLLPSATSETRTFLAKLAIATAQLAAERNTSREAHSLLEILISENPALQITAGMPTPFKSTPRSGLEREGLRWEDGISEWVAASPMFSQTMIKGQLDQTGSPSLPECHGQQKRKEASHRSLFEETVPSKRRARLSIDYLGVYSSSSPSKECSGSGISTLLLSPISDFKPSPLRSQSAHKTVAKLLAWEPRQPLADRTNANFAPRNQGGDDSSLKRQVAISPKHSQRSEDNWETEEDELAFAEQLFKSQHSSCRGKAPRSAIDESDNSSIEKHVSLWPRMGHQSSSSRRKARGAPLRSLVGMQIGPEHRTQVINCEDLADELSHVY